jgi:hypothetical protein
VEGMFSEVRPNVLGSSAYQEAPCSEVLPRPARLL